MKIAIISGSHRKNSESARIGTYMKDRCAALALADDVSLIELSECTLPFWDEEFSPEEEKSLEGVLTQLNACDGVVVIAPEWAGMVPSALKNFFLLCGSTLAHKPAMIVGVSSSFGGAYPVAELRMSSYKNSKLCYIPEHVIVRQSTTMFHGETPASEEDGYLRERVDFSLAVLVQYAKALRDVRASGVVEHEKFSFGMS